MSEGIPDEIVRALSAVGFVLFAENIAGEFSFERYSPVREAELLLRRSGEGTWELTLTARRQDEAWEPVPLPFLQLATTELNRELLERRVIPLIDAAREA